MRMPSTMKLSVLISYAEVQHVEQGRLTQRPRIERHRGWRVPDSAGRRLEHGYGGC